MAFINEYISEADCDKYDLRKVCGEHNEVIRGVMCAVQWAIDRERDAFLIETWTHREAESHGYGFYWKGEWLFFELRVLEYTYDKTKNALWFRKQVKGLVVPDRLISQREALIDDLREALTRVNAVSGPITNRSATIEFVAEEQA